MRGLKLVALVVMGTLLLGGVPANGQTDTEKAAEIRESGIAAYEATNYGKAKALFDSAVALSPSATSLLWSARARVKLQMLVEALDFYRRAAKPTLDQADASVERGSREVAADELDETDGKVPRLRIYLDDTTQPDEVHVTVNGHPIERALLERNKTGPFRKGRAMKLNPGKYRVVGVKGEHRQILKLTLKEGQKRQVRLRFPNPETVRQRKCRDACEKRCGRRNQCYLECKRHCFTRKKSSRATR